MVEEETKNYLKTLIREREKAIEEKIEKLTNWEKEATIDEEKQGIEALKNIWQGEKEFIEKVKQEIE